MSSYFDMVINCDLREDTPAEAIEAIKCLISHDTEMKNVSNLLYRGLGDICKSFYNTNFLAPDPDNGIISNFYRRFIYTIPQENNRKVYRYRLQYCGIGIHDDHWAHCHMPFAGWLASVSNDKYMGYYKLTDEIGWKVQHLLTENGQLKVDKTPH